MAIIIKSHKDTLLIDSTIGINYNSGIYNRLLLNILQLISQKYGRNF